MALILDNCCYFSSPSAFLQFMLFPLHTAFPHSPRSNCTNNNDLMPREIHCQEICRFKTCMFLRAEGFIYGVSINLKNCHPCSTFSFTWRICLGQNCDMKLPKNQTTVLNCGHRSVTKWLKMTNQIT